MPQGHEKQGEAKIKRYMTMMDSMTDAELDSADPKLMKESRIVRIARGSGRPVKDVLDMLEEYKRLAKMWSNVIKRLRKSNKGNTNAQQISKSLPPELLTQIGGIGGLRSLLNQTVSKEMGGGDR
ncbi:hypothetical protein VPH35_061025 [Triticum aestivum]